MRTHIHGQCAPTEAPRPRGGAEFAKQTRTPRKGRLDACLAVLDRGLRRIAGVEATAPQRRGRPPRRASPADEFEATLSGSERRRAAGLMRVNHCGEVCAQALYEGQALTARSADVRAALAAAARDEEDHLAWCRQRLDELDSQPSLLDPAFDAASFLLGGAVGLLGDRLSLGFVAATEDGVRRHLDRHLERLPEGDAKSRAVLEAMRADEMRHGADAARAGGVPFPKVVKGVMALAAKAMTTTTYRL